MYRLGSDAKLAREMVLDDILRARIELLLFMAKVYSQGACPGDRQCRAMEGNAIHVETECYSLMLFEGKASANNQPCIDNYLCPRLKLLAVMIKAVAQGRRMGSYRKKAMLGNVEAITKILDEYDQMNNGFLKEA